MKLLSVLLLLVSFDATAQTPSADTTFTKLLVDEWEWGLEQNPTRATAIGDARYNDRMGDYSEEAIERRR